MKRALPRNLLGQMILLMGAALLVAQLVNFAFILNGQQRLSLAQNEGPATSRFVEVASRVAAADPDLRDQALGRQGRRFRVFTIDRRSLDVSLNLARDSRLESRLRSELEDRGVAVRDVHAARSLQLSRFRSFNDRSRSRRDLRWQMLILSAQLPDGSWINGRVPTPQSDPWLIGRLALATLVLYIVVLGAMLWIAARIARPLGELTRAAESFQGRQDVPPVEPRGPSDLKRAIEAFNAMNRRVVGLLDEKDRMLGAIGHDLRTPLASMRIRAEGVTPEDERDALVRTIEEMSGTLEDILALARTGRSREPMRRMDVSALVDAVVEDYAAMDAAVTFEDSPRIAADVQPNLLRRAVRNLVDNALAYGQRARVRVVAAGSGAAIEVDDDGPGIPADQIEAVLQPFTRLEGSRSRETGGAGLGLAIAKAVAEAHGGSLALENRPEGGLRARLSLT